MLSRGIIPPNTTARCASAEQTRALVQALREKLDANQGPVELCETHISYVLLTNKYAYKIKKPVDLGFANFSTLALRQYYCDEELRLNRRLAEDLYLGVVRITGSTVQPEFDGEGEVVEYAVKMTRFAKSSELGACLESGSVAAAHFRQFAIDLVGFHAGTEIAESQGNAESELSPEIQSMDTVTKFLSEDNTTESPVQIDEIRAWLEQSLQKNSSLFQQRRRSGKYRDCHGDLHLGNLVLLDDRIVAFDCIEFNPSLRWIDVASEVAFLFMDLQAHGYTDHAWQFLNQYLAESDDYGILDILDHYVVYRAMVRTKVLLLSGNESEQISRYIETALAACRRSSCGQIVITHGVSGSGKSWLASRLAERCGAVQIRSDAVRKHLAGIGLRASSHSGVDDDLYDPARTEQVYHELARRAERVLAAGYCVIVDATFLDSGYRDLLRQTACKCGAGFSILHVSASREVLTARLRARQSDEMEISEAGQAVLDRQLSSYTGLSAGEQAITIDVDSGNFDAGSELDAVAANLGLLLAGPV